MTDLTPRLSAHLGYMFTELPFADRFRAAREAGFALVEAPAPYADLPVDALRDLIAPLDLRFVQMGLALGDQARGEKGLCAVPGRQAEFRAAVLEGLDYAAAVGIGLVHPLAGQVSPHQRNAAQHQGYLDNLHFTAIEAEKRGLRVLVEPMSHQTIADFYLGSFDQAVACIDEIGHKGIGILLDVYHETVIAGDPAAAIRRRPDLVWHLHLSDVPGRHEPGSGRLDFVALRQALVDTGCAATLGCEYKPAGSTCEGLGWRMADWALGN